jgi:hypothetical protein
LTEPELVAIMLLSVVVWQIAGRQIAVWQCWRGSLC